MFRPRQGYLWFGGGIIALVAVFALFGPLYIDAAPEEMNPRFRLQPPSSESMFGTDEFGRDVFARVVYGTRTSLAIGIAVVLLTTASGMFVGLVSGYYYTVDRLVMRVLDGFMAFPELILAITLAAVWGSGSRVIVAAMSFAYFPRMARIVRGVVLRLKQEDFVESARSIGAGDGHILFKHILPNCWPAIIVQATFSFSAAVLAEAALSFLGVGIQPPAPSLGGMVSDGRIFMTVASWITVFPGITIILVVLGLNLLGDGLRDYLDPLE